MIMRTWKRWFTALVLLWVADNVGRCDNEARLTVATVDEQGTTVTDVSVAVTVFRPKDPLNPWAGLKEYYVEGSSNWNGEFCATAEEVSPFVGIGILKDGYYKSEADYEFTGRPVDGKWQPWNPTIPITLRQKVNPIPLYARRWDSLDLPALDTPIGYDLLVGDWVAPHGKGQISDFVLTFNRRYVLPTDCSSTFTLAMSGEYDGFVGIPDQDINRNSKLRFPREAPQSGYSIRSIIWSFDVGPGGGRAGATCTVAEKHFFFRIRAATNQSGQVTSALYGKLVGPVEHDTYATSGGIKLTYYVNPTPNDRSLEFALDQNLFTKLHYHDRPREP